MEHKQKIKKELKINENLLAIIEKAENRSLEEFTGDDYTPNFHDKC